jgi:oligopeptide/dipeptide ABC transporter ATP-binding protein
MADQVMVMHQGSVVEMADSDELYRNPQHPYTRSLLAAIPRGAVIAKTVAKRPGADAARRFGLP